MLSTLRSWIVLVGSLSHDALRVGSLHPTELSTNGVMLFVNIFMDTIRLPHSTMPLLTVRRNSLIIITWTQTWDNKLWITPPFHLIQQVMHKIKQDKTQAILVVPLSDDKPWFQELQDICADNIELPRKIKLYARDDAGPLCQRSWSSFAFLVDGGLPDCDSADSGTNCCVGSESEVERGTVDECTFSIFLCQILKVIRGKWIRLVSLFPITIDIEKNLQCNFKSLRELRVVLRKTSCESFQ